MEYMNQQLEIISLGLALIAALGIAAAAGIIKFTGGVDDAPARTISPSDPGYELGLDTSLTWRGYWQYLVAIHHTIWVYVWFVIKITAINLIIGLALGALLGMVGLWWLGFMVGVVFWVIDMLKADWDFGGYVEHFRS